MTFTVRFVEGDDGWILAVAEEFPNLIAKGRTKSAARREIMRAVRAMVAKRREQTDQTTADRPILGRELLTITS
jgi:hypothetical protein